MERRLHRGLEALMGSNRVSPASGTNQTLQSLPIDSIRTNPRQPRKEFDPEKLGELAASIQQDGLLQPIVVRRADVGYELIAGERRWRACKSIGMDRIAAMIRTVDGDQQLVLALVENIQRADLNAIEEGMAIRRLIEEFDLTHEEVAKRVGRERSTVSNSLRLLDLPTEIRDAVSRGTISAGHGRALLPTTPENQKRLYQQIVTEALSVRQTEKRVKELQSGVPEEVVSDDPPSTTPRDPNLLDLESRLRTGFGVKTTIKPRRRGGVVTFQCATRDQLDYLLERLLDMTVTPEEESGMVHDDEFPV